MTEFEAFILITGLPLVLLTIIAIISENLRTRALQKKKWNNGYCSKCKSEWQLKYTRDKTKIYKCTNRHVLIVNYNIDTRKDGQ